MSQREALAYLELPPEEGGMSMTVRDPKSLVLFLGAGASAGPPASIPDFRRLMCHVLAALGWTEVPDNATGDGKPGETWQRPGFPPIQPPWRSGAPPEVVFRVLNQGVVNFADPIEGMATVLQPNAAHKVAAALLAAGGCVWTPNIDMGVEKAWKELFPDRKLRRSLGAGHGRDEPTLAELRERDYRDAGPGVLVKFHGTADIHRSLAFTDHELLTPLPDFSVARFAELASGAHLVFFGYRAADGDLLQMLHHAVEAAARTTFLVADTDQQAFIREALPISTNAEFLPLGLTKDFEDNVGECAKTFLTLVDTYGVAGDLATEDRTDLGRSAPKRLPDLTGLRYPNLVHAGLVERLGMSSQQPRAFWAALRADLASPGNLSMGVLKTYARSAAAWNFYHGGILARLTLRSIHALRLKPVQRAATLPGTRGARDLICSRGPALLLDQGKWREILGLTEYSIASSGRAGQPPKPGDLYYHAHCLRYLGQVAQARDEQQQAEAGLTGTGGRTADPERLAGTILEQGLLDLDQGRFDDCLIRANDLLDIRGRYAIQRWESWGRWLAGAAALHRLDLPAADQALSAAWQSFTQAGDHRQRIDVSVIQLLAARVSLALGRTPAVSPDVILADLADAGISARLQGDLALIHADLALARDQVGTAQAIVTQVLADPATPLTAFWAELVRAEVDRADGRDAQARFQAIAENARSRGATWLQLQATAGLVRVGAPKSKAEWHGLAQALQLVDIEAMYELTCTPRGPVLWATT